MNKDTVPTATSLYYSVFNHLIGLEINSERKLNTPLHILQRLVLLASEKIMKGAI